MYQYASSYLLSTRSPFDAHMVKVQRYVMALNEVRDHFTAAEVQADPHLSDNMFMLELRLEAMMWTGEWPEC